MVSHPIHWSGITQIPPSLTRATHATIVTPKNGGPCRAVARTGEGGSNQTGSGLYHPIVKEQVLPGQLEGTTDKR